MKKLILILLACCMVSPLLSQHRIKVLHMTFHEGCMKDFQDVAHELDLDLTSWFVQRLPQGFWEGFAAGNEIYNVGARRAKRVWDLHHEFFNQFDVIVTSDTAPLSRIFLQNGWNKPLIIWICNRFDYAHGSGGEDRFPDKAYYDLIQKATRQNNVRLIAYTPFEHEYMRRKGIEMGTRTIKPVGRKEEVVPNFKSSVPDNIVKEQTLFIVPRLEPHRVQQVQKECAARGLNVWTGVYNGPEDVRTFKGVIFFPYAFSNLMLFENFQRGVVHFVPSMRFLTQLNWMRSGMHGNLQWIELYRPENSDYLVYFDSWDDLKVKVETTQYDELRSKIRAFGIKNRVIMLDAWRTLFSELGIR